MTESVQSVLSDIQSKINVPKNQHNKFGGYNYRSLEDILMALKPLLATHGAAVTTQDELVLVGERYYVKATATLTWGAESVSCTGYAREAEDRKGMDASQVTGSTSSYARKYAMNGLFAIDDNKDADATNTHGKEADNKVVTKKQASDLAALMKEVSGDEKAFCKYFKISKLEELPASQHDRAVAMLESKRGK